MASARSLLFGRPGGRRPPGRQTPPPPAGRWAFHQRQKDKKPGPTRYGAGRHNRWEEGGRQGSAPPGGLNHLAAGRSRRANPAAVARISPPAQGRRAKPGPMAYGPGRHNASPRAAAEGRTQPLVRDYSRPRRTAARVGPRVFVRPGRRLRRSRPSPWYSPGAGRCEADRPGYRRRWRRRSGRRYRRWYRCPGNRRRCGR